MNVTECDAELLRYFDVPRTVSEHIAHVNTSGGAHYGDDDVRKAIERLRVAGLLRKLDGQSLRKERQATETLLSSGDKTRPWISIPTVGRVDETTRLLRSIEQTTSETETQDVAIILDTYSRRTKKRFCETIDTLRSGGSQLRCRIVGKKQRFTQITRISKRLSLNREERRALSFGVLGDKRFITTGSTQTYSLLCSPGNQLICFDDDVVSSGTTGAVDSVPCLTSRGSLTVHYVRSRDQLSREYDIRPVDVPRTVRSFLGKSVSELATAYDRLDVKLDEVSPEYWSRLERSDNKIDAVVFGTIGDSGVGQTSLLVSDSIRVPQFAGDTEAQSLALTSRAICSIAAAPTITTQPFFMTGMCAYNLTRLLPPFFPYGRGQDGLFGLMYTQILDDTLIGQIPVALLHDPQDGRPDRTNGPPGRISMTVCRVVGILASCFGSSLYGGTRQERVSSFGTWLRRHSRQPIEAFRLWIVHIVCESLKQYENRIIDSYGEHIGTETPLGVTIESLLMDIRENIRNRRIGPIDDYNKLRLNENEEFEQLSEGLYLFGVFLELWPTIWDERTLFQSDIET